MGTQPKQREDRPRQMGASRRQGVASRASLLVFALALWGCGATSFVSTWKAPDAQAINAKGTRVAAVVMMRSDTSRRAAEDRFAKEISARGAQGIASYRLVPNLPPPDEAEVRRLLEKEQIKGVVVLRPIGVHKQLVAEHTYLDPMYGGYWGGYYSYGWGNSWGDPVVSDVRTDTVVSVETLVYSLEQNKLLWGGQSKTTNPQDVDQLVSEVASAAADELRREGLVVD
jgi:hypothetical protein